MNIINTVTDSNTVLIPTLLQVVDCFPRHICYIWHMISFILLTYYTISYEPAGPGVFLLLIHIIVVQNCTHYIL